MLQNMWDEVFVTVFLCRQTNDTNENVSKSRLSKMQILSVGGIIHFSVG